MLSRRPCCSPSSTTPTGTFEVFRVGAGIFEILKVIADTFKVFEFGASIFETLKVTAGILKALGFVGGTLKVIAKRPGCSSSKRPSFSATPTSTFEFVAGILRDPEFIAGFLKALKFVAGTFEAFVLIVQEARLLAILGHHCVMSEG